ncbi:uncharacterized protein [Populus alba]|uniref:uncharacterized protein n=1 Tax=Populus alba TaxID=43335 RepID=UPI003CC6FB64
MNVVVGHEAVIDLKSDTKVTRLNSLPLSIPRYYFNFTDFAHILNKEKGSRLLTGEELRITLWGDIARSFDDAFLAEQDSPVIVVFAGFRVSEFRGKKPEKLLLGTLLREEAFFVIVLNERFTCKVFIVDYDLFKGWWCQSCPDCNKPLSGLPNNLRCMEHDYPTSAPVSWFRINCIVNDSQDVTNFLLSGKTAEYFFNASAHHLVFDKKFTDPFIVPPQMIEKLNKTKIFQLRFGAYKSLLSRCEIYVCNIFDDIPTEASVSPVSPIEDVDTTASITSAAGSSVTFTPLTPNLADPLNVDQTQIHTPASQQHTSP